MLSTVLKLHQLAVPACATCWRSLPYRRCCMQDSRPQFSVCCPWLRQHKLHERQRQTHCSCTDVTLMIKQTHKVYSLWCFTAEPATDPLLQLPQVMLLQQTPQQQKGPLSAYACTAAIFTSTTGAHTCLLAWPLAHAAPAASHTSYPGSCRQPSSTSASSTNMSTSSAVPTLTLPISVMNVVTSFAMISWDVTSLATSCTHVHNPCHAHQSQG